MFHCLNLPEKTISLNTMLIRLDINLRMKLQELISNYQLIWNLLRFAFTNNSLILKQILLSNDRNIVLTLYEFITFAPKTSDIPAPFEYDLVLLYLKYSILFISDI